jgi:hypothetical protein
MQLQTDCLGGEGLANAKPLTFSSIEPILSKSNKGYPSDDSQGSVRGSIFVKRFYPNFLFPVGVNKVDSSQ